MVERRRGPIRPPVIDLAARDSTAAGQPEVHQPERPDSKGAAGEVTSSDPQPDTTSPAPPPAAGEEGAPRQAIAGRSSGLPLWTVLAGTLAGALLGTALTYFVAGSIPLPASAALPDVELRLSEAERHLSALEEGFVALRESATDTQLSLDATLAQIDTGFASVGQEVTALRAEMPGAFDPAELDAGLRQLAARVDAIAAGASSADAEALVGDLQALRSQLAAFQPQLQELRQNATATETALEERLAALELVLADRAEAAAPDSVAEAAGRTADELADAIAAGRSFASQLNAVAAARPDLDVPEILSSRAETGLPRPAALDQRLVEVLPQMIAAGRLSGSSDWTGQAADWLRDLLALRPAGELDGDSPEAVISRIEGAMARRDYAAADALFATLPEPVRLAAGALPADIAAHAEAARLIALLRGEPAPREAAQ